MTTADTILAHLRRLGWTFADRGMPDGGIELTATRPGQVDRVGTVAGDDDLARYSAACRLTAAVDSDLAGG